MQTLAERSQIRQHGFAQAECLEVAQVVCLGADQQVIFQVAIDDSRRGWMGFAARRGWQGHRCRGQVQIEMRLGRGGLESQNEKGQQLKCHVQHRRHRECDFLGRLGPISLRPRRGRIGHRRCRR